jgi:hypothetical protein
MMKERSINPKWQQQRRSVVSLAFLLVASFVVALFLYWRRENAAPLPTDNPVEIYDRAEDDQLYAPVHLHIDPMEGLLLVNFENDPDEIYIGFEPQLFDDPIHGRGSIVIAWRVDGRVDVYHQPGLTLDPETYDIAGGGLNEMLERPLSDGYYQVNEAGVEAYFAFEDAAGRPVEVTIQEKNRRQRQPFGLLAPMGSAATAPSALPLVYLHDFYFVRQADTTLSIKVNGQDRQPDTLPLPIDGTRMTFIRYSPDPLIATLNPAHDGPLMPLTRISPTEAQLGDLRFELVDNHGWSEIAAMRRPYKERSVNVIFTPPLPHLLSLAEGTKTNGRFTISADPTVGTLAGTYQIRRQGDDVHMEMVPSLGWQPNETKPVVRLLYWIASDFTNWPKTYRWTAVIDLSQSQPVTMHSGWQRTQ